MKIFYTLIFGLFTFALVAQISHKPNPLIITAPVDSVDVKLKIYFKLEKDTTYEVHWKLLKDSTTWMQEWQTQVCDLNLCYLDNRDFNNPNLANEFKAGDNLFELHFKPNGKPGCTILTLVLYSDRDFTQELYRTSINVNNCISNVVNVASPVNIKVYPNPATEYFQINNGTNVEKIKLYNMFGREIKSFYHYNHAQHEIGELKSGMYLLKMLDNKNRLIKTVKLNKVFSGT
jgi:hypothetical protein